MKIGSAPDATTVYDGAGFSQRGIRARKIDPSYFGTRHGSMLRYCKQDRKALGIVVSQDGYVRLIMTVRNSLVFWDNIKLLGYGDYSRQVALRTKKRRMVRSHRWGSEELGYTKMPKTVDRLLKATSQRPKKTGSQSATRTRPKTTRSRPR